MSGPPTTEVTTLGPGTPCYDIAVVHIDRFNQMVVIEFSLGVVAADGSYMETSRAQFTATVPAFAGYLGTPATTLLGAWSSAVAEIPTAIAPLFQPISSLPWYGS